MGGGPALLAGFGRLYTMRLEDLRECAGMIIPVWYPESMARGDIETLLDACIRDVAPFAAPANVRLVIDGAPSALAAATALHGRIGGFEIDAMPGNEGKGGAVVTGLRRLLKNPRIRFFVTRDHDNDHLAQDTPNLVNLAENMVRELGHERVMTIGRRISIHRHLGFVRGEFEWFMNEVIQDAVKYAMARDCRVANEQYIAAYEPVLEMQTGFKCYTRETARMMIEALDKATMLAPGLDVRRHGAEVPVIVETLLQGGVVGEINRLAYENQPITTYDLAGRVKVKGTVLAWTFLRTGVPVAVARQLLLNAMGRRVLSKDADGLKALVELSNWALRKTGELRSEPVEPMVTLAHAEFF